MQVKLKRLSAFVLAVIISISYMNYSVHAEEIPLNEQTNEQTGENKTQELDKLTLPAEDSTETENTEKGEASESVESIPEDVGASMETSEEEDLDALSETLPVADEAGMIIDKAVIRDDAGDEQNLLEQGDAPFTVDYAKQVTLHIKVKSQLNLKNKKIEIKVPDGLAVVEYPKPNSMTGLVESVAPEDIKDLKSDKNYEMCIRDSDKGEDISITDIPDDMKDDAEMYHTQLVEQICELDDDLMMEYLEGEEPSVEALKAALRKGTCECTAVPICCGTAYRNKGVQKLLDAVLEFMPAPTDIAAIKGVDEDGNEIERHSSDDEPFAALAFKIMTDPFVGKLAFFRVYSGTMNSGSYVLNATKQKKERVGRILQMHANKREELDKVYAGDIAAAVGFKITATGDTICDEKSPVILESMEFPEPVIDVAIEPKTKAGQGKMSEALAKLAEEDPTFKAHTDEETGQTIISGMGELHLEIIVDRLLREFKVEANVGAPQVAYKESFTKEVDVDSKYAKQSGGRGQYGHCKVHFEPMDANGEELFKFESTVVGGNIPKEYIPAVGAGIEEAAQCGILGGFPVLGVKATVYDGSYHDVDSSEMAFKIAGSMAFKEAMQKAGAIILEPIMRVEVTTPEDYMGDVIGDINSRRGRIEGMDDVGGGKIIRAFVPLAEMFGYSTDLRSRTQGRGNYSMFFNSYEPVPKSVQEKIIADKTK